MNKKTFCVPEKRQFCRYIVIDMEYGFVLSAGERYKNLLNLQYVSDFRSGFLFRRKLKEYISVKAVKGRKCIIVFWAGASERIPWNVVFSSGCFLGIRGGYKKTNSKFKKSKKYVHHIETSISKFLLCEFKALKKRGIALRHFCGTYDEYRLALDIFKRQCELYLITVKRIVSDFTAKSFKIKYPDISVLKDFLLSEKKREEFKQNENFKINI